jgi:hypothetical protein
MLHTRRRHHHHHQRAQRPHSLRYTPLSSLATTTLNSLLENIAFLIRHNQSSYGKTIEPNEVSVASRGWQAMQQGSGPAGIGVFVNGNGYSHTVVRAMVSLGEGVVERLGALVDMYMQAFFSV